MAAITWYLTNNSASVGSDLSLTDPGAEAYRSPVTGWIVATGATNHAAYANDVEVAAADFSSTTPPDGSLDTTNGDFWVSPSALSGSFAAANWNVHLASRAQTVGGAQDGRMRCRLFRGPNQDGSGATEITGAQQNGGLVTNLATSATQVSTATFNPGAFSVTNEYIFVQLAWERTGAGGMTTSDVNLRIGNASAAGSRVITSNFLVNYALTASSGSVTVSGSDASLRVARKLVAATGAVTVSGTAAGLSKGRNLSASSGSVSVSGTAANLKVTRRITADTGAVTVSGTAASLRGARKLAAGSGSVNVIGTDATLTYEQGTVSYTLTADSGSVTVTGTAASLRAARKVGAAAGSISITGTAASLRAARKVGAATGTVTVSGTAAGLKAARRISAASGSISVTGTAANLTARRLLAAGSGIVVVTGTDATLSVSGGESPPVAAAARLLYGVERDREKTYDKERSAAGSRRVRALESHKNRRVRAGASRRETE